MNRTTISRGNIVELLSDRAQATPDRVALRFVGKDDEISETFTYGELHRRVCALAAHLREHSEPGDRALLLYVGGSAYALAILACAYASVIAVPAYPPESVHPRHLARLLSVIRDARPKLVLTSSDLAPQLAVAGGAIEELRGVSLLGTDMLSHDGADAWRMPDLADDAIAFLQYTSGSTSIAKGVMVGHSNVMANEEAIRRAFGIVDDDVVLSWLPLFHDMGLVGGLLQPLYSGISSVLLTPQQFIERPSRWLSSISRFGATVSGGPDFAYRICADRISDDRAKTFDLRRWRVAFCGAEPIRARSMRAFAERFAASGFDAGAIYPCYGLAESTLLVTGGKRGSGFAVDSVDRDALGAGRRQGGAAAQGPSVIELVDCGVAQLDHHVVIVDRATGAPLAEDIVGEIQIAGPSVTRGYFRNDVATADSFVLRDGQRFLRTGDLGYLHGGHLFVTGRDSEKIIVCGQNLYPQDIERTVEDEVSVVRKGRIAAFSVVVDGVEGIGLAAEVSSQMQKLVRPEAVCDAIVEAVAQAHGQPVTAILLLSAGGIPLTSSGKIQRTLCKKRWEKRSFEAAFHLFDNGVHHTVREGRVETGGAALERAPSEALSPTEQRLAQIWKDVLGVATVRRDDGFFALGGSSLKAAQLRAAIDDAFDVRLPMRAAFTHPTLGGLARAIDTISAELRRGAAAAKHEPIVPAPLGEREELSDGEARMYFLQRLDPESRAYWLCERFRLTGPLDENVLRVCLDLLVARHESLRTTFTEGADARARRVVHAAGEVKLRATDLSALPPDERTCEAARVAECDAIEPFDLEHGPLVRVHLLKFGPELHELVVSVHHIIADAWSIRLLVRELASLCATRGDARALGGETALQYADYAYWQRRRQAPERIAEGLAYWRTTLGGEHPVLQLPSDRPRPANATHRGERHSFTLDASRVRSIRELGERHGATPFMVLLAAVQLVLHRYSGQRDLRVGVPYANRAARDLEGLVGFFVNTLVIRTELSSSVTIASLLRDAREATLAAHEHESLPFERVVEELKPVRNTSHNPIFQVLYNHLGAELTTRQTRGELTFERIARVVTGTQLDLSFDTTEIGDEIVAEIVYATDLFDRSTIERLSESFVLLLDAMTKAAPETAIAALPLLDGTAATKILEHWNATQRPYALDRPIHERIEDAVRKSPNAVAVCFEGESLTYAELDARAEELSRVLVDDGVGPDVLVGVCAERSIELVVALYAVLRADGAYLPLEPTYPSARLRHEMDHARPRVILTQERFLEKVRAEAGDRRVRVLNRGEAAARRPVSEPRLPRRAHPENLAYCIFTSGSTGQPKAVANTHKGLVNRLAWMQEAYPLDAGDRVLQKTPFTFDVSVWEFFWPLMTGATLVVAKPGAHKDTAALGDAMRRESITTVHFVPSMLHAFVQSGELAGCTALRQVFSSGEALSSDLVAKFFAAHAAELHNLYGPTEAAIDVTAWACRSPSERGDIAPPIGRPIANMAVHVLDERLKPVPVGVTGDLYLAGVGLARGYLGASDLTADRFVPNPFRSAGRLYRTGDLARYRADGAIEYQGRSDHQVKVRGHRIELGEIESRIREHEGVRDVAVSARADGANDKRLVAYVVPKTFDARGGEVGVVTTDNVALRDALKKELTATLPDWMIPQLWVFLPALPLSSNGKLDRAALPAPDPNQLRKAYVAPRTEAERTLGGIWENLLQVDRVGVDDNFFELGGDSILALQVVGKAKRLGLGFAVKAVFDHQTLGALAAVVEVVPVAHQAEGSTDFALTEEERAAVANEEDVEDVFPLSPMQQGLLLHTLLEPGSGIYLMQDRYRLESELDIDAFLRAWESVVERHAALRASFAWKHEGRMLQIIHRTVPSPVEYLDLRALPEAEREAYIDATLLGERTNGMDMARAPLMRVRLVRLGETSFSFVQSYHHILIDDWCRSLMLVDFFRYYQAYARGETVRMKAPRPYRDFIAWTARQDAERARTFWRRSLAGVDAATELSIGVPVTDGTSHSRIGTCVWMLDKGESEMLRVSARRRRLTVNTIAQGAWAWVLSELSGSDDVLFGVTVAGRPAELDGIQDTVGLFINTVPLRVRMHGTRAGESPEVGTWLAGLLAQNVELREHEWLPLTDVQACSDVPRGEPLLHSLFVFENAPLDRSVGEFGAQMDAGFSGNRTHTNYPITVVIVPGDRYRLQISYDERFFEAHDVERVLASFRCAMVFMSEHPEASIADVPRTTLSERRQMAEWNRTERSYPFERGFVALLAEQVKATPGLIAVSCGESQATYAELQQYARNIGFALKTHGVGPCSRVVTLTERGVLGIAAIVGTFMAGGAYLALDVGQPEGRLAQIVRLAAPACIVAAQAEKDRARAIVAAAGLETPILVLEDVATREAPVSFEPATWHVEQPAYVIFTSGSTGEPKGAVVTMRGMLNNQLSKVPYFGFTSQDVIAQTASPSFDISVWQSLAGLLCGARVEVVEDSIAHRASALMDYVALRGITILESVPSLIRAMLEDGERAIPSLRWMIPTGEALPPELARRWFERFPTVPLVNAYGPAECADDVALHRLDRAPLPGVVHVPIGRPTDNARLFIFDKSFRRAGLGSVGEIGVAGVGLGHGYLGDPAKTAEAFVPNPFAESPGERLYRTGDRGRLDSEGVFTYVGRVDHQVKVRGHRIELGEIESRLAESPEIAACVVAVREIAASDKRLVAYVVPTTTSTQVASHVREWLRARLPEYMVPAHVVRLEALPLSANGKVDRKRLPGIEAAETRIDVELPVTPTELALAEIWSAVLQVPTVGRRDGFFELGGHSLLVTQVASRIAKRFGVELSLRTVFETPVLADLAAKIDLDVARGTSDASPAIVAAPRPPRLPPSFGQRRLWFMWQMDPKGSIYNLSEAARWRGRLQHGALRRAFEVVVERHEALRTTFEELDGEVFQKVAPAGPIAMPIADARFVGDRDEHARKLAEEEAARPFDLRHGPLLRLKVIDFSEDDHVVLVTAHHIAADGWSMHLIVDELTEIYGALSRGRAPMLPELPIQYPDFAIWQREWLRGVELERQMTYWKAQLGTEHPVLALPSDRPRPPVQSFRGGTYRFDVAPALADALRAVARAHDTTLFTVSLAAFMVMLARYTGDGDVRVGVPVATRQRAEIQSLVGFFVNTHVFRLGVRERESFDALVDRLKEVSLGAQAHQDLPFEQLVESLNPERSLGHSPLFQVLYNHVRPDHRALGELDGVQVSWTERKTFVTEFDMTVDAIEDIASGSVAVSVIYSTDLFDPSTIERFTEHWQRLLAGLAVGPDRELRTHRLLRDSEVASVLPIALPAPGEHEELLHGRVARIAEAHGERVAVRCGTEQLTYRELRAQSVGVARALRDAGVGAETRVAVAMDRSPSAIAVFLGVLEAGGTFVPIGPELPRERVALLLEESGARVLVSRAAWIDELRDAVPPAMRTLAVEETAIEGVGKNPPWPAPMSEQAAYVIFTSGSTGTPKGVVVTHGALAMHAEAARKTYGIGASDVILHMASFTFDAGVEQWAVALGVGACVELRGEDLWTAEEIFGAVEHRGVTVVDLPPGLALSLAHVARARRRLLPNLLCIVGGEALMRESCEEILASVAPRRLINAYGPTEAVMTPLAWVTEGRGVPDTVQAPIGRPLGARTAYVLDEHLAVVPLGVEGELYVGGQGLARGYLGSADRTAERFVPDPFGEPGTRLYRTGDRARVLADGAVVFCGRADRQIKLRGFRIEPGEIEVALLAMPQVRAAFVHLQTAGERQLVAYVVLDGAVPADNAEKVGDDLRTRLRARMPEYMVPSFVVVVPALPRTSSGKVDVRSLPKPQRKERAYEAPSEPLAITLASIWQSVLNVANVGLEDNFFELGGDSILALQAVGKARAAGIAIGPRDIFQHQTIGALASVARWLTDSEADFAPVTGDVDLTPIQAWFFDQNFVDAHHWNQSLVLSVPHDFDGAALNAAIQAILVHHDALRLRFFEDAAAPSGERRWRQTHRDDVPEGALRTLEIGEGADLDAETARVGYDLQRALNLETGNVIRFVYLRAPQRRGRLVIVAHHLVVDGVSWRILLEDLESAYMQCARGEKPALAPKTTSLQRWSKAMVEAAASPRIQGEIAYWRDVVGSHEAAASDGGAAALPTVAESRTYEVALTVEQTNALVGEANRAYRTQVNDLLLAGLARAWSACRRGASLLVELEGHGREPMGELDVSRTVGWFTVQYPLSLSSEGDVGRTVVAVKAQLRQVPSAGAGYGLLRYLRPEGRSLGDGRRPDLTFNYLGQTDGTSHGGIFAIESFAAGDDCSPAGHLTSDLEVNAFVREGKLRIHFRYASGADRRANIERLATAYVDELAQLVAHCASDTSGALVASDFAHAHIDQADLDDLVEEMS